MNNAKISVCVVIDGHTYRTAHNAAEAYSTEMIRRLNYRNMKSATSETDLKWGSEVTARKNTAYKRIHPIFKKLFKA